MLIYQRVRVPIESNLIVSWFSKAERSERSELRKTYDSDIISSVIWYDLVWFDIIFPPAAVLGIGKFTLQSPFRLRSPRWWRIAEHWDALNHNNLLNDRPGGWSFRKWSIEDNDFFRNLNLSWQKLQCNSIISIIIISQQSHSAIHGTSLVFLDRIICALPQSFWDLIFILCSHNLHMAASLSIYHCYFQSSWRPVSWKSLATTSRDRRDNACFDVKTVKGWPRDIFWSPVQSSGPLQWQVS